MAHSKTWDATLEAKPGDADEAKEGAGKIREHKVGMRERVALQHFFVPGTNNNMHGVHKFIPLEKGATHTLDPTTGLESCVKFSGLAANVELDLPAVSGLDGLVVMVINEDAQYQVDLDPNLNENIDNGANGAVFGIPPFRSAILICDEGNGNWVVLTRPNEASGLMKPHAGSSAPPGYLLCDGTTGLSTTTNPEYAALYQVIGITFGGADATDFDLPDLRGRLPLGLDNMGGASANRVTSANADSLGSAGGKEDPDHTHTATTGTPSTTANAAGVGSVASDSHTHSTTTSNPTFADAEKNMNPYLALNWVIKI